MENFEFLITIVKTFIWCSLGHVYTATGDYANALASHKQCVELIRSQLEDKLMVKKVMFL